MNDYDELWPGGPRFRCGGAFPLSTDSVLLADFAGGIRAKRIVDLGSGAGVLSVLLSERNPGAEVCAVELLPEAAALCRENLERNGHSAAGVLCADLRDYKSLFPAGHFDLTVSNPPYFPTGSGYTAPEARRATARDERSCSLDALCAAAAWLTRWGGAFALVHRPERLSELCCTLSAHGLEPKRLRWVQHRPKAAPNLVLVEARRGGRPGLKTEPPLVLCDEDGQESGESRRIYHRKSC